MKKKLLLLGAEGMLGHTCLLKLSEYFFIFATTKQKKNFIEKKIKIASNVKILNNINLLKFSLIENIIKKVQPNYIVNCAGIINKKMASNSNYNSIIINSLLPHKLAYLSDLYNMRFVHISTDCVFDGIQGNYFENDKKSAYDFYGQTKSIGEDFFSKNSVIIRTSIIGHEIKSKLGLLEWFLNQKKKINGYSSVQYSGLTTLELQKYILFFLLNKKNYGIFNVASKSISKYDLLKIIKIVYNKNIKIIKNRSVKKNMILRSKRLNKTGVKKPQSWKKQIQDLKKFYEKSYQQS